MAQVDASIPLQVQMPQLLTPMQAQTNALNLKDLMLNSQMKQQQFMAGQQNLKNQQLLAQMAAVKSNIDPETGGFTPEAISNIQDPMLRQQLNNSRMDTLKTKAEIDYKTSQAGQEADKRKTDALHSVFERAYGKYEDILDKKGNKQAATDAFNAAQQEGFKEIKDTGKGGFAKDTQFKILSPEDVLAKLTSHKERMQERERKESSDNASKTPFIRESEYLENLKGQLADLRPNDPGAKALVNQISQVERHIAKLDAPSQTTLNMNTPVITDEQSGLSGDAFLKTLPAYEANQVRAIGEGRQLLQDLGVRGKARERLAALVNQAYPDYDSGNAKTNRAIEIDFAKGKPAQSLQSINAVTEHLSTYRKLAKALDNGDVQLYNKYKTEFERATGQTLPNDLKAAAPIIGSEIVKAIVPGGGGVEERASAKKQWDTALSNKQVESQIDNVYIPLMQGQISGLRQHYEGSGKKDFNTRFLTPEARKSLNIQDSNVSLFQGNTKAADIKAQYQSGKMTREQARAALAALGQ